MAHYEVEIKSLLGSKENAEALKTQMCEKDPACNLVSQNKQLNHYFEGGDINTLYEKVEHLFNEEDKEKLKHVIEAGKSYSIRSRQKDENIYLVVKASVDEGSSANTVSRLEFEEEVNISLDELDKLLLDASFTYQAKWSREREEYEYKGVNVCLDKNAGYGYLAEFEKVFDDEDVNEARKELDVLMAELGVVELPQDRLERMFAHYNANWEDYYGTDKTFTID
ncbi:CYTH domain-containing protein [Candidatus Kaiserbacteria bacterium]|nr:CYTH domain-containing protein [Candidatus Kaiserbacteria bacterium]